MIMAKNLCAFRKSHASAGKSRSSQFIFQSSSIVQSCTTGPSRKACSSGESLAGASASSLVQSGLPVNRSASHQTSPASIASRSVFDRLGKTPFAQRKMKLEMYFLRTVMCCQQSNQPRQEPRCLKVPRQTTLFRLVGAHRHLLLEVALE